MIRLVATDLDNTFLPAGGTASDRALEGVRALLAAGVCFAPVTGRPPSAMRWMLGPDKACYQTDAFVNGQMVFVDVRLMHVEPLDVAAINEMADFVFPVEGGFLIDLVPAGWGKDRDVQILAEHLGVGLDEVAAFGDSENDLALLGVVENSVAVANASDAVARAARWHIGDVADDAAADALFQIAEASAKGVMPAFMCR